MSKLIIINGPLGSGKSTLAQKYAQGHPLTLQINVDTIRRMISFYREEKDLSGPLSKQLAVSMARTHLNEGYDVVISQIFYQPDVMQQCEHLCQETESDLYECVLTLSREESLRRFIERGIRDGHPDGFRPGGSVDIGGREKNVLELYDTLMQFISTRPNIIPIPSIDGEIEQTYQDLLSKIR